MAQVAFDTLQASEELQTAGLTSQQAKAISLVVRKSHEVADVATKADIAELKRDISDVRKEIADVRKDLSAEIADVRKDLSAEIANVRKDLSAEIANVRKDLSAEIANVRKDMDHRFEKVEAQILDVRKDISMLSKDLLFKLGGLMVTLFGLTIAALKFL
ncbi:hypothetical protein QE193_25640 (plasmid) [Arsenophonus nasoniae]|uniref:hypothetical protein n=1 Tax=Arsenophonus nasoniae TaxID=638 RepID=UPI0024684737|nr:hypothetical protein [Arsenophonus nasoniae]WGM18536.1 hypothetical protein QE193_25640 [Arsenophonus nasoniae]